MNKLIEHITNGIIDKIIEIIGKKLEYIIDEIYDEKINERLGKNDKLIETKSDITEKKITVEVDKKIIENILDNNKKRRSKVKSGNFVDCPIVPYDGNVCIVSYDNKHIVPLTTKTIEKCIRRDKKFNAARWKYYYYLDITFKDGQKSSIRISESKMDNIKANGVNIIKQKY